MTEFSIHRVPPAGRSDTLVVHVIAKLRPVNSYIAVRGQFSEGLIRDINVKIGPHLRVYHQPITLQTAVPSFGRVHIRGNGGAVESLSFPESDVRFFRVETAVLQPIHRATVVPATADDAMIRAEFMRAMADFDSQQRVVGLCIDESSIEWSFEHMVFVEEK